MRYVYLLAGIGLIAIIAVLWKMRVPHKIKHWLIGPMFVISTSCTFESPNIYVTCDASFQCLGNDAREVCDTDAGVCRGSASEGAQ